MSPAAHPVELELKYAVADPDALARRLETLELDGLTPGTARELDVVDHYFDTRDETLAAAGYGARLRHIDGTVVVSLKGLEIAAPGTEEGPVRAVPGTSTADAGALHRRREIEAPATEALDPTTWPETEARQIVLDLAGGGELLERFVVRQRRLERRLEGAAGSVNVTLDRVCVLRRGQELGSFAQVEAELTDGDDELLDQLAEALEATGLVQAERRSKERIARELAAEDDGAEPAPAEVVSPDAAPDGTDSARLPRAARALKVPKSPGITPDDELAEAGRKVLRMQLARMLAAEPGTREGSDIEQLHKMRVATRRMRAAWRVFEGAYRPKLERRYVRELRRVASALGAVRDLDVQLETLEGYIDGLTASEAESIAPLLTAWRERRDAARGELLRTLDSGAYRRFVDDYLTFVLTPGAGAEPADATQPRLVRHTAAGRIWNAYEHVRAYETVLPYADVETLHALRIVGKRLRYTIEFFAEALPDASQELATRVTTLQDHLGALNDAHVAAGVTRAWLVGSISSLTPAQRNAIGAFLGSREREAERLRRSYARPWRGVAGIAFRSRLARMLGSL